MMLCPSPVGRSPVAAPAWRSVAREPLLTVGYESCGSERAVPGGSRILAEIGCGPRHVRSADAPGRLTVGLQPLSDPGWRDIWRVSQVRERGWEDGIGRVECDDLLFAHLLAEDDGESDLDPLAGESYRRLLDLLGRRGFPHPWC